jgi:beta-amylase
LQPGHRLLVRFAQVADVWWGIVEGASPQTYKWSAYQQMVQIARSVGLKIVFIMSFHQCGGNVGDTCDISIPGWILSSQSNIYYKDREGNQNMEYIS